MMTLRKIFIAILLFSFILSACTSTTTIDSSTRTPRPNATADPSVKGTPIPAASKLNVPQEALRGVQVKVWHPGFGAQASLFEAQVAQFNTENELGIIVSAEGKDNYSELFSQTSAALKDSSNPQVVIAFPEHALEWQDDVVDLNPYLHDPEFGWSALEI